MKALLGILVGLLVCILAAQGVIIWLLATAPEPESRTEVHMIEPQITVDVTKPPDQIYENEYITYNYTTEVTEQAAAETTEQPEGEPAQTNEPTQEPAKPPEPIEMDPNMLYAYFYKDGELYPVECGSVMDSLKDSISISIESLLINENQLKTYIPEGTRYQYGGTDYGDNLYIEFSEELLGLKTNPELAEAALDQIYATVAWAYEHTDEKIDGEIIYSVCCNGVYVPLAEALGLVNN